MMKFGMLLVEPLTMPLPITWNSGLLAGLVPPIGEASIWPRH